MSPRLSFASLSVDAQFPLSRIRQRLQDLDIDVDDPEAFKKEYNALLVTAPLTQYDEERTPKYFPWPVHSTPIEIYYLVRKAQPLTEEGEA